MKLYVLVLLNILILIISKKAKRNKSPSESIAALLKTNNKNCIAYRSAVNRLIK